MALNDPSNNSPKSRYLNWFEEVPWFTFSFYFCSSVFHPFFSDFHMFSYQIHSYTEHQNRTVPIALEGEANINQIVIIRTRQSLINEKFSKRKTFMLKRFKLPTRTVNRIWAPGNAMYAEVFRRKYLMLATYSENVFYFKRWTDRWMKDG